MNNGLTDNDIKIISSVLEKFVEVETAVIYGSRALGNFKKGSDVDISLKGENLSNEICSKIHFMLEEETLLPYFFDITNFNTISNINLIDHINRVGEIFYKRGWFETTLGEIVTLQRGHDLPLNSLVEGDYIVMGSNGIIGKHDTFTTKGPGITIGRSGNIGNVFFIKEDFWAHNTTLYSKEFHDSDPKYVFYLLKNLKFERFNTGSAVPSLNRNLIHLIELSCPRFNEQKAIAVVLSSLDDKIELLREENKTLEELAQTIFKEWFVNFNYPDKNGKPYKSNGGKMVQSELGEIPERWSVGKYNAVAEVITGKGIRAERLKEDGAYDVYGANGIIGKTDEYLFEEPLIITGRVGTLGKIFLLDTKVWISDNVLISKPLKKEYYYYDYFLLKSINFLSLNVGSTQPLVTQTDLRNVALVLPPIKILLMWDVSIALNFSKISNNNKQIQTLTQLRDSLIPKLISGEVRVK